MAGSLVSAGTLVEDFDVDAKLKDVSAGAALLLALNSTALGDASTALQPACSLLAAGVRALNLTLDLQRVAVTAAAGDLEQDIDEVIDHLSQLITGAFTPVIPEAPPTCLAMTVTGDPAAYRVVNVHVPRYFLLAPPLLAC